MFIFLMNVYHSFVYHSIEYKSIEKSKNKFIIIEKVEFLW